MIDGGRLDSAQNSPIFNELKSKSVFFSNSITYGPHTIAAMHAVFSGSYGTRTGTNSYWTTFKFKKDKFKTLTEYLKDNNFYTHADVINELVIPRQGFDNFIVHDELNDDLTKRHKDILKKISIIGQENKNFFLYLHYSKIHTGIMNEVLNVYNNNSKEFFDNRTKNKQRYDTLFKNAEIYLQSILDEINNLGLEKNALILVMSDHGISVGEKFGERAYGAFCYDYTIKTFAYYISPDFLPQEINQQVRHIDFMPTILDHFQISQNPSAEKFDGVSLLPLINGTDFSETTAYTETGNPLNNKAPPKKPNTKSIRTSTWKLIFNEYDGTKELYNLKSDPEEKYNLISQDLEIEIDLWKKLVEHM